MNLNSLATNVMLHHSAHWLGDSTLRAEITATPIGAALLALVEQHHQRLATQSERRRLLAVELARLTETITELDAAHNSLARAIYEVITALSTVSLNTALVDLLTRLKQVLFPEGITIVQRSHAYKAGAVRAMEERITADDMTLLSEIKVGDASLADWYQRWVDAGKQLGLQVHARAALYESVGRGGSGAEQIDIRSARYDWISIVRSLLNEFDHMKLSLKTRERISASLAESIVQAQRVRRRSDGNSPGLPESDDSPVLGGDVGVEPDPDRVPAPDDGPSADGPDSDPSAGLPTADIKPQPGGQPSADGPANAAPIEPAAGDGGASAAPDQPTSAAGDASAAPIGPAASDDRVSAAPVEPARAALAEPAAGDGGASNLNAASDIEPVTAAS